MLRGVLNKSFKQFSICIAIYLPSHNLAEKDEEYTLVTAGEANTDLLAIFSYTWTHQSLSTNKSLDLLALCGHWVLSSRLTNCDGW